jgi:hypothetical protein
MSPEPKRTKAFHKRSFLEGLPIHGGRYFSISMIVTSHVDKILRPLLLSREAD